MWSIESSDCVVARVKQTRSDCIKTKRPSISSVLRLHQLTFGFSSTTKMSENMDFKITRLWDGTKDFSKDADILVTLSGNNCALTYAKECTSRK